MIKLPVGISSFEKIREEGYLYVDKTRWIYRLIDCGKYYFLSRPRRFGKSLLVSTLKCLFEGRRELFDGLWIEDKWDWKKSYPVVVVDFNEISSNSEEELECDLRRYLINIGSNFGLNLDKHLSLKQLFLGLIIGVCKKRKKGAAIIIDEYDKAIINHLGLGKDRLKIAYNNRQTLKEFYGVIKGQEVASRTKFVLLTGVSKFSQVSVFSELNNLADITMSEDYSEIMGITEDEISGYFTPYLDAFGKKQNLSLEELTQKVKLYYNGYRFSEKEKTTYNPFSLFRSFQEQKFQNYWFETGTPSFLVNLIKEKDYYIPDIENLIIPEYTFSQYDLENLKIEPLLFQTGYLTIKEVIDPQERIYHLSYPNLEVKKSFLSMLFYAYSQAKEEAIFYRLKKVLESADIETFIQIIKSLFAGISYPLSSKLSESYFHTIFYLIVSGAGVFTETEVLTADGRIDLVVHLQDKLYIMEFKCSQSARQAIEQIKQKQYPQKYQNMSKPIYLLGINFSLDTRNVQDWEMEISP